MKIKTLSGKALSEDIGFPKPDRLIEGPAKQLTQNHYEGKDFYVGFWSSGVGAWHIDCAGDEEYCRLLEGVVELVDQDGSLSRFKEGDEFIIPEGFIGIWRTIEPCRKLYVIANVGADK